MQRLRRAIGRVAEVDAPVLVQGDTGTGKELVARTIHESGPRRDEPFVAISCAALSAPRVEATLFGEQYGRGGAHERSEGLFSVAGCGTILLDGIGELPLELQPKLLRALGERRFLPAGAERDVPLRARVIACTSSNLADSARRGAFRLDLLHRLNVLVVHVPTLAARGRADFEELLRAFAADGPRSLTFSRATVERLAERAWTGNVRELRNVVCRLATLAERAEIDVADLEELAPEDDDDASACAIRELVDAVLDAPMRAERSRFSAVESMLIEKAIERTGNAAAAARLLGRERRAFMRRRASLALRDSTEHDGDDVHE